MDFEETKALIKEHDYDVRSILESLSVNNRSIFLGNVFDLFSHDDDNAEIISQKRKIASNLSETRFKESFDYHLPHTIWMHHAASHSYYGLSALFAGMSDYGIISPIDQTPPQASLPFNTLSHLMQFYDHESCNHNIVWALENIEPSQRTTFMREMFTLAKDDQDADYANLQYTLLHQLPHIAYMLQQEGQLYEGLGSVARTMREHDVIYCP